jgi:hypothetical protein
LKYAPSKEKRYPLLIVWLVGAAAAPTALMAALHGNGMDALTRSGIGLPKSTT